MKAIELKGKSKNELEKLLGEKRAALMSLRFKVVTGSLKNVREIRAIKKDIARILTAVNSFE